MKRGRVLQDSADEKNAGRDDSQRRMTSPDF
jgi:hypothetical protein